MEDIALNLVKAIVIIAISIPFCILFFGGIALVVMQIKSMLNLDTNKKFTKDSQLSMIYKVIKVNNFLESYDNYPEYSFICDVKTGKVYKYINNKNNEYIFNYYEEIGSTCPCCGSVLTSRTCDYCGTLTKDKLDVRVVAIALKQYGYKTEYEE